MQQSQAEEDLVIRIVLRVAYHMLPKVDVS